MFWNPTVSLLAKTIILRLAKPTSFLFKLCSQEQLSLDAAYCISTTDTDESFCGCLQSPEPTWAHKNTTVTDGLSPCLTLALRHHYASLLFYSCSQSWYFRLALHKLLPSLRRSQAPFVPSTQTLAVYPRAGETASGNHAVTENLCVHPIPGSGDHNAPHPSKSTAQIFLLLGIAGKKVRTWNLSQHSYQYSCELKPCPWRLSTDFSGCWMVTLKRGKYLAEKAPWTQLIQSLCWTWINTWVHYYLHVWRHKVGFQ